MATFAATLTLNKVGHRHLDGDRQPAWRRPRSAPIAVTAAAATHLQVTIPPQSTTIASDATFGFTVSALDPFGNVDTSYGSNVTASISAGPNGGGLFGTKSVAAIQGVATFTGLSLNLVGSYTLSLAGATLPTGATLGPITVNPSAAAQLIVSPTPPSTVAPSTPFTISIMAEDKELNPITAGLCRVVGLRGHHGDAHADERAGGR